MTDRKSGEEQQRERPALMTNPYGRFVRRAAEFFWRKGYGPFLLVWLYVTAVLAWLDWAHRIVTGWIQ